MKLDSNWQALNKDLLKPLCGIYVLALVVSAWIFAILKLNGTNVDNTMWAEDGKIFLQQAFSHGGASIWMPYAGYLHVYPRLVALLSTYFNLSHTPLIFFMGWLGGFTSFAYVVGRKCNHMGASLGAGILILMLLLAHPHQGEVFFNLTNAQWFIGAALSIYVLVPEKDNASIYEKCAILIASLTGPYALLLLPALLVQLALYQDWRDRKYIYILMSLGAAVQFLIILHSGRATQSPIDPNLSHWLHLLYMFFMFGNKSVITQLAAIAFWWATVHAWWCLKLDLTTCQRNYYNRELSGLMLVFSAIIFCIGSLVAIKSIPDKISPIGDCARYFFIPYILILLSTLIITLNNKKIGRQARLSLTVLSLLSFSAFNAADLQFKSYAAFTQVKQDVSIPIRPEGEWNVHLMPQNEKTQKLTAIGFPIPITKDTDTILKNDHNQSPQTYILLKTENLCLSSKRIGIEMEMTLNTEAYLSIGWGKPGQFTSEKTLTRSYHAGDVSVEFALPIETQHSKYLSFKTSSPPESYVLHKAKLYCL